MAKFLFIFLEIELEDTRQENMTHRWQNGAISNFEYLMYLNRLVFLTLYESTSFGSSGASGYYLELS